MVAEWFHTDGQTTKLIVSSHNFANVSKNEVTQSQINLYAFMLGFFSIVFNGKP